MTTPQHPARQLRGLWPIGIVLVLAVIFAWVAKDWRIFRCNAVFGGECVPAVAPDAVRP